MVVLGGGAVSYERGTPVGVWSAMLWLHRLIVEGVLTAPERGEHNVKGCEDFGTEDGTQPIIWT